MSYPARLLVFYAILLALGTFHPFVLEEKDALLAQDFFDVRLESLDPFTNILLLVPLGVILRHLGLGPLRAALVSFLVSLSIEVAQHWVAHRVSGIEDLTLNTAGGVIGALQADRLTRWLSMLDRRGPRWLLLAAVTSFVLWSASPPVVMPDLWRWSRDAVVVAGSDPADEVPWPGSVRAARLYAGALAPDMLPPNADWSLDRDGNRATSPAMCDRITAANGLTIDLDLEMPKTDLLRPGAVFMYAIDFNRLNVLVGHWEGQLRFRVKTRVTPVLGSFPDNEKPLVLPAFPNGERHRLTLTFDGRSARAYVDGRLEQDRILPLPAHNGQRRFWLPRERWGAWLFVFSAALVISGAAAGVASFWAAAALGALLSLSTEVMQILTFARAFDAPQLLFASAGALLAATACRPPQLAAGPDRG